MAVQNNFFQTKQPKIWGQEGSKGWKQSEENAVEQKLKMQKKLNSNMYFSWHKYECLQIKEMSWMIDARVIKLETITHKNQKEQFQ